VYFSLFGSGFAGLGIPERQAEDGMRIEVICTGNEVLTSRGFGAFGAHWIAAGSVDVTARDPGGLAQGLIETVAN
jgi:hypothetical protein